MLAGELYNPADKELADLRTKAHRLCMIYNNLFDDEESKRLEIIHELIPNASDEIYFQGPIYVDYGVNIKIGKNFYANFNTTILDCCEVIIGDDVMFGPNVSIVTPVHSLRYQDRNLRMGTDGELFALEYAKPIIIGKNSWLASNVTVIGGCKIGEGCVIGAGSVVTKDIPENTFAAGVPCRSIRSIE